MVTNKKIWEGSVFRLTDDDTKEYKFVNSGGGEKVLFGRAIGTDRFDPVNLDAVLPYLMTGQVAVVPEDFVVTVRRSDIIRAWNSNPKIGDPFKKPVSVSAPTEELPPTLSAIIKYLEQK